MADLPVVHCDSVTPPPGYRTQYECVSPLAGAGNTAGNERIWVGGAVIPEGPGFAEMDLKIILPDELWRKFRLQNVKRATATTNGKEITTYSYAMFGPATVGDCQPYPADCVTPNGLTITFFFR
jgi:hypothetical protein